MLARSAYDNIRAAIHQETVAHNESSTGRLELVESANRLEVFQHGLIFPTLTLLFDEGTAEISYRTSARISGSLAEHGTIVPGYAGKVLLLDKNGVAHRIAASDLVATLLRPARERAHACTLAA
jgi:hypothetical protein